MNFYRQVHAVLHVEGVFLRRITLDGSLGQILDFDDEASVCYDVTESPGRAK